VLEHVRNGAAHEPEVHALGRLEAHGLDRRRREPVRTCVMRSEHDVTSALEHLELSGERARNATEVRAGYDVEHHLAGSNDAQC